MKISDITQFLEAQKTIIDSSLSAIKTLSEHSEQQRQEIVKLTEQLSSNKEDK